MLKKLIKILSVCIILLLTASLPRFDLFFLATPEAAALSAQGNNDSGYFAVKVVSASENAGTMSVAKLNSEIKILCNAPSNTKDVLQNTASLDVLFRPSNCGAIVLQKSGSAVQSLEVKTSARALPQVVVYRFPDKVSSQYAAPFLPFSGQQGSLPVVGLVYILATMFLYRILAQLKKAPLQKLIIEKAPLARLQILRC